MKNNNKSKKVILTDCLCFESFFRVGLINSFRHDWYFASESKIFTPFRKVFTKLFNLNFKELSYISYPDERYNRTSIYERIQDDTKKTIREFLNSEESLQKIKIFSKPNRYNPQKLNHFLTDHYFPYVYRFVELVVLSNYLQLKEARILLKKSPINEFCSKKENITIHNYSILFTNWFPIRNRSEHYYDQTHLMRSYFRSMRLIVFRQMLKKLSLIFYFISYKKNFSRLYSRKELIGIELVQRRINLSETNDLFFTNNNDMDDAVCCLIEQQRFNSEYREDSYSNIRDRDFQRLKFFNLKTTLRQKILGEIDSDYKTWSILALMSFSIFFANVFKYQRFIISKSNSDQFLSFLLHQFSFESAIWLGIYKKFNIKILWSMLDGGFEQASKSQAIELNEGIYAGSHWSNYPISIIDNYKPYDVLFSWSHYFSKLLEADFKSSDAYEVGYIATDYFKFHRKESSELKDQYKEKFIITFNDNVFYKDIAISEVHYDAFYSLIVDILNLYENVVIFIKPKRVGLFKEKKKSFKELNKYITNGRARVFLADNERSKITPGQVAIASDLVIGLGISTTTLESVIAGTPAINFGLCQFNNNNFYQESLNKVVFNDTRSIKKEIHRLINSNPKESLNEHREFYRILDPFLDQSAGTRIGKKLMELLNS